MNEIRSSALVGAQKLVAFFVALSLCVGLTPAISWADDAPGTTISVALSVVDTTDAENGVLANVKVDSLTTENTVADLLAAAGFVKADSAEATVGNDKAYADSYGSPVFRGNNTLSNSDGAWTYWASMYNGDSANYASATLASKLQDGGHYQYIYTNAGTFAYSEAVPDPLASEGGNTDDGDDKDSGDKGDKGDGTGTNPGTDTDTPATNLFDATKTASLVTNLSARYAKGGKDASISNATMYAAIALNANYEGAKLDSAAILESMNGYAERNSGKALGAGQYGKYIMALSAAGVTCTEVDDNGTTRNLVKEMEEVLDFSTLTIYDAVFILPVYSYDGRSVQTDRVTTEKLINLVLEGVDDQGLFGDTTWGCDAQTTAQAILALLPYRSTNTQVDAAITKAATALLAMQNGDGGFGYSTAYPDSDIDATANVVAALAALGYDCEKGSNLTTENGSTPVGYLIAQADATLDGYLANSGYDESMTSATVLMGLVAAQGYTSAAKAFNVYTVNQVSHDVKDPDADKNPADSKGDSDNDKKTTNNNTNNTNKSTLAQTGDSSVTVTGAALLSAACSLLAATRAWRREGHNAQRCLK